MKLFSPHKSCGTCLFAKQSPCSQNKNGACLGNNYANWVDVYTACEGCKYEDERVWNPATYGVKCTLCTRINRITGVRDNYE